MDKDPSPTRSVSFEEALSNAIRLARLAEEDDSGSGRRQATAQLATAWGTIAQALASKTPRSPDRKAQAPPDSAVGQP